MMLRAARLSYLVNVSCLCLALGFVVSELLSAPASNTANKHKHKHHRHFPHFPWDPKDGSRSDDADFPFQWTSARNAFGLVATAVVAALSNAAGIGGGPFFVPLYNIVIGFGLKAATGLSQAAIAGGSLASLSFNLAQHHPWDPTRPLVDLDLAVVLTPALLLGVSVGVILNDIIPDWIITGSLVVLLGVLCRRTTFRGLNSWHEETQRAAAVKAAAAISGAPQPDLAPICTDHADKDLSGVQTLQVPATARGKVAAIAGGAAAAVSIGVNTGSHEVGDAGEAAPRSVDGVAVIAGDAEQLEQQQEQQRTGEELATAGCGSSQQHQQHEAEQSLPQVRPIRLQRQQTAEAEPPSRRRHSSEWQPCTPFADGRPGLPAAASASFDRALQSCEGAPGSLERASGSLERAAGSLERGGSFGSQRADQQKVRELRRELPIGRVKSDPLFPGVPRISARGVPIMEQLQHQEQLLQQHKLLQESPAQQQQQQGQWPKQQGQQQQQQEEEQEQPLSPAVFGRIPYAFSRIKLLSLLLLWAGFLGLSAIDALLPLCTWRYVFYMLSFVGITLAVTATFIRAILVAPAESRLPIAWQEAGSSAAGDALEEASQPLLPRSRFGSSLAAMAAEATTSSASEGSSGSRSSQAKVAAMSASVAGAAGVVAGVVGVGGGTMIGPILLEFGVHPQVATATSTVLVFMSSSAATLSYWMQGRLVTHFAVVFATVSALASLGGITAVAALVRRTGRPSLIVLLLAGCMGVGGALALVFGGIGVVYDVQNGEGLGFAAICDTA